MAKSVTTPMAAIEWVTSGDTGASSKSLWAHFMGAPQDRIFGGSYPHDPADLGRCLRLLARVPEWRERINEAATLGPVWAALVARWDELEQTMADEVGVAWEKGQRAPKTYDLMRAIIEPVENQHYSVFRAGAR